MADEADIAETMQTVITSAAINNRVQYGEWDGIERECTDCGENIPIPRLKSINATRCVMCAELNDKRKNNEK